MVEKSKSLTVSIKEILMGEWVLKHWSSKLAFLIGAFWLALVLFTFVLGMVYGLFGGA